MKIRGRRILLPREQFLEFSLLRGRGFEQKHDVVEEQRRVSEALIELGSGERMNIPGHGLHAIRIHGASDAIRHGSFANSGKTRGKKGEDTQKARKFRMDEEHKVKKSRMAQGTFSPRLRQEKLAGYIFLLL